MRATTSACHSTAQTTNARAKVAESPVLTTMNARLALAASLRRPSLSLPHATLIRSKLRLVLLTLTASLPSSVGT